MNHLIADARTALPQDETVTLLEPASIAALVQLDPAGRSKLVVRVLSTYLQSKRRLAQGLVKAHAEGDLRGILLSAHTLKSSSASIGAKLLAQRCALLESALQGSDRSRLPDLVQAVLAEADRVEAAVQALLGEFSTASPP